MTVQIMENNVLPLMVVAGVVVSATLTLMVTRQLIRVVCCAGACNERMNGLNDMTNWSEQYRAVNAATVVRSMLQSGYAE